MRRIAALFVLTLLGCADSAPESLTRRLELAEQRWQAWGSASYDYTFDMSCFCLAAGPRIVEVRNGVVARTIDTQSGVVDSHPFTKWTVDSLFAQIHRSLGAGDRTEATFDGRGIPAKMIIGTPENDAGYGVSATKYVRR